MVNVDLCKNCMAGLDERKLTFIVSSCLRFYAGIAQLVEHNLAKVGVAGSNPVFRSPFCPGGGTGRHAGLKILYPQGCTGSSPVWGTLNPLNHMISEGFLFLGGTKGGIRLLAF